MYIHHLKLKLWLNYKGERLLQIFTFCIWKDKRSHYINISRNRYLLCILIIAIMFKNSAQHFEKNKSLPCYQWHAYREYRHLLTAYEVLSHCVHLLSGRVTLINAYEGRNTQQPNKNDRVHQIECPSIFRHIHRFWNFFLIAQQDARLLIWTLQRINFISRFYCRHQREHTIQKKYLISNIFL